MLLVMCGLLEGTAAAQTSLVASIGKLSGGDVRTSSRTLAIALGGTGAHSIGSEVEYSQTSQMTDLNGNQSKVLSLMASVLAAAHIGVAMGARGSDSALEQADVVLMHDRLESFLAVFSLSQRARRIIRQNLVISLGTVAVLVCFALAGKIPLTIGVVGHEGSTVIVVMNSLRLLLRERHDHAGAAHKRRI